MRPEDFELMYQLEEGYWWFAGMRRITEAIVGPQLKTGSSLNILDAGCGTGFNLVLLESMGPHRCYGIDVSRYAIEGLKRRGLRRVAQASITEIPFPSDTFDFVFSFEVLDAVPGDIVSCGFREIMRVLKPAGSLFLRLPAFEWLHSSHDDQLGTLHRYTRDELAGRLRELGLEVRMATYANTLLFPVAFVRRLLKHAGIGGGTDVRPLPVGIQWLNPIFLRALEQEAAWFRANRRFPIGLSVIAYAKKPQI